MKCIISEKKCTFASDFNCFAMDTHIGFELCTAGNAEVLTVSKRYPIYPGIMMIHSPVFPMLELSRSNDYASLLLHDSIENLYSLIAPNISSPQQVYSLTPLLLLTDEQQGYFRQCVDKIQEKEHQLASLDHPLQKKLLSTVISLLKKETIMEHAFLFSEQILKTNPDISHKRQVLIKFLLSLNIEFRQHRTVNYYASKQGLSPRHFADIIKHESEYTPMQWVNMVTINQAKNLLRQPNIMVKQVADELGFPEQFTFRKYFKTHTGISPSEYQTRRQ